MTRKPEIGTVSHGTLRIDDLLVAFANECTYYGIADDLVRCARDALRCKDYSDGLDEFKADTLSEMQLALNDIAPDGCYFGAHEGDGSDFGFWPQED